MSYLDKLPNMNHCFHFHKQRARVEFGTNVTQSNNRSIYQNNVYILIN